MLHSRRQKEQWKPKTELWRIGPQQKTKVVNISQRQKFGGCFIAEDKSVQLKPITSTRQKWAIEAKDQTLGKCSLAEDKLGNGSQRRTLGKWSPVKDKSGQ